MTDAQAEKILAALARIEMLLAVIAKIPTGSTCPPGYFPGNTGGEQ